MALISQYGKQPYQSFPNFHFLWDFPACMLHVFLIVWYMLHIAHLIVPDLITLIVLGEEFELWGTSLCIFLHHPVMLSFKGPNIFFSTVFSNILSLCSSLREWDLELRGRKHSSNLIGSKFKFMEYKIHNPSELINFYSTMNKVTGVINLNNWLKLSLLQYL